MKQVFYISWSIFLFLVGKRSIRRSFLGNGIGTFMSHYPFMLQKIAPPVYMRLDPASTEISEPHIDFLGELDQASFTLAKSWLAQYVYELTVITWRWNANLKGHYAVSFVAESKNKKKVCTCKGEIRCCWQLWACTISVLIITPPVKRRYETIVSVFLHVTR